MLAPPQVDGLGGTFGICTYNNLLVDNVRASEAILAEQVGYYAGHYCGGSENHEVADRCQRSQGTGPVGHFECETGW